MTKACTAVMISMAAIMIAGVTDDRSRKTARQTSAAAPQASPQRKYPGNSTPTMPPARSRLYDLKMAGVSRKVNRAAPPIHDETARRYKMVVIRIGDLGFNVFEVSGLT